MLLKVLIIHSKISLEENMTCVMCAMQQDAINIIFVYSVVSKNTVIVNFNDIHHNNQAEIGKCVITELMFLNTKNMFLNTYRRLDMS